MFVYKIQVTPIHTTLKVFSLEGRKHCGGGEEEILVSKIVSFSHNVINWHFPCERQKSSSCGNGLIKLFQKNRKFRSVSKSIRPITFS